MRRLRLTCADPQVDVTVDMGDGPATPTAGSAAWEVIERVEGKSITDPASLAPFTQTVPILLDGLATNTSVAQTLAQVLSLRRSVFRAHGPIHRSGERWVYGAEPEFGEAVRADDGRLIRQRLTLTLMEYVPPEPIRRRRRFPRWMWGRATSMPSGTTYISRQGDTLASIAARWFNDWRRWPELSRKNGINDPFRKLPPGRKLRL